MSLLDDARRLADIGPAPIIGDYPVCAFCGNVFPEERGHTTDCPWLAMPLIVATLEAVEGHRDGS